MPYRISPGVEHFASIRTPGHCLLGLLAAASLCCQVNATSAIENPEIGQPHDLHRDFQPGDNIEGVRLLGALQLRDATLDGIKVGELSGLAWDTDAERLYAVSDMGSVVHLAPRFDSGYLTGLELLAAHPLTRPDGQPVTEEHADSESMALRFGNDGIADNAELLVAFERLPRLERFRPDGTYLGEIPLPDPLADATRYETRNRMLEAMTEHPRFGQVYGLERPLKDTDPAQFTLYASAGDNITFEPLDAKHSNITALETTPAGDLLFIERRYINVFRPILFALRRIRIADAAEPGPVEDVIIFKSSEHWHIDNFEGLAHHEDNRYFIVSDDNRSPIQTTLLLYVEVLDPS